MINKSFEQLIIVISSPSGTGKTSVCKEILKVDKKIKLSISYTTRKPRDNEINGIDYNFISHESFKNYIKNKEFIEYAKVFGNFYGSSIKNVVSLLDSKFDVLFDIDWQGAKQISQHINLNIVTIFLVPPSKDAVYERLKKRSQETGDNSNAIEQRMNEFENEMLHKKEYMYVVVNDDLKKCTDRVREIIKNERMKLN